MSERNADGFGRGWQTKTLGRLQLWMFQRGWRHIPNTLSTLRWLVWRATGGFE